MSLTIFFSKQGPFYDDKKNEWIKKRKILKNNWVQEITTKKASWYPPNKNGVTCQYKKNKTINSYNRPKNTVDKMPHCVGYYDQDICVFNINF